VSVIVDSWKFNLIDREDPLLSGQLRLTFRWKHFWR